MSQQDFRGFSSMQWDYEELSWILQILAGFQWCQQDLVSFGRIQLVSGGFSRTQMDYPDHNRILEVLVDISRFQQELLGLQSSFISVSRVLVVLAEFSRISEGLVGVYMSQVLAGFWSSQQYFISRIQQKLKVEFGHLSWILEVLV